MMERLSFIELLQKGGISVVILGFFSVLSIALMLERAWAFYRFRKGLAESSATLDGAMDGGGAASVAAVCRAKATPLGAVFLAGYGKRGAGRDEVLRAMELAGRGELSRLDRFVGVLGTIGSTSPFVGLFGTVLGIIRAFSDLAASQGASPAAVADGIAEALVATAAGLFVAVPAVMAYNYFVRASDSHALMLEAVSDRYVGAILDSAAAESRATGSDKAHDGGQGVKA